MTKSDVNKEHIQKCFKGIW